MFQTCTSWAFQLYKTCMDAASDAPLAAALILAEKVHGNEDVAEEERERAEGTFPSVKEATFQRQRAEVACQVALEEKIPAETLQVATILAETLQVEKIPAKTLQVEKIPAALVERSLAAWRGVIGQDMGDEPRMP